MDAALDIFSAGVRDLRSVFREPVSPVLRLSDILVLLAYLHLPWGCGCI